MNCHRVCHLLSAYTDEQTSKRERLLIGLHLTRCPRCRIRFSEVRHLRLALLATPGVAVPAGFSAGWRVRLRQEQDGTTRRPGKSWSRLILATAPAAACLLLLATGLMLFFPRLHEGEPLDLRPQKQTQIAQRIERSLPPASVGDAATAASPPSPSPSPAPPAQAEITPRPSLDKGLSYDTQGKASVTSAAEEPRTKAAPASEGLLRSAAGGPPRTGLVETDTRVSVEGSWRVWLTVLGPRPSAIRRVLAEKGMTRAVSRMMLDGPLLLRQGLTYTEAHELAQCLEEAGGRAVVELVPR